MINNRTHSTNKTQFTQPFLDKRPAGERVVTFKLTLPSPNSLFLTQLNRIRIRGIRYHISLPKNKYKNVTKQRTCTTKAYNPRAANSKLSFSCIFIPFHYSYIILQMNGRAFYTFYSVQHISILLQTRNFLYRYFYTLFIFFYFCFPSLKRKHNI